MISNLSVLTVSTSVENITCNGQNNGTASISVVGGVAPYTYSWSGPDGFTSTEASLTGLAAGIYKVVVTDAQGTTVEESVTVAEPDAIITSSVNIINDSDDQGQGSITIDVKGGTGSLTFLWSNGETTSTIKNLNAGSYTCTVTDANGCQKVLGPFVLENTTSTVEAKYLSSLNIFPNPASNIIHLDVAFINKENVTLEISNNLGHNFIVNQYDNNIHDIIDIADLPGGVYHLSIIGKEFKITRRVIVIR
ncbi:MAG: T9SS type A sorting domain-containing protein [Chitinophagales bacterium]|nr:T9SS type A sorting domain-containing protein [Chitinophagales bacterium]